MIGLSYNPRPESDAIILLYRPDAMRDQDQIMMIDQDLLVLIRHALRRRRGEPPVGKRGQYKLYQDHRCCTLD